MKVLVRVALTLAFLAVGVMAATSSAQAVNLDVDHCTGGCGTPPFGTVSLTQNGANVDIVVHLLNGNMFIITGAGGGENFGFNATGVALGDITIDAHVPALTAVAGPIHMDGAGDVQFGIGCPSCPSGAGGGFAADISFHVANALVADFSLFVADILSGQTGNTGVVSSGGLTPVPEPGSLLLLGSGLVSVALWGRKRLLGR